MIHGGRTRSRVDHVLPIPLPSPSFSLVLPLSLSAVPCWYEDHGLQPTCRYPLDHQEGNARLPPRLCVRSKRWRPAAVRVVRRHPPGPARFLCGGQGARRFGIFGRCTEDRSDGYGVLWNASELLCVCTSVCLQGTVCSALPVCMQDEPCIGPQVGPQWYCPLSAKVLVCTEWSRTGQLQTRCISWVRAGGSGHYALKSQVSPLPYTSLFIVSGIIDILQQYYLKKRGETFLKSVLHKKADISSVAPDFYAKRFHKFLSDNTI